MGTFLTNVFGAPDYTSLSQYQAEYNVGELFPDDIIIFHNPYKAERGWGHVGIGHSPTYDEGSIKDIDETNIWIIHRASWGEPARACSHEFCLTNRSTKLYCLYGSS